MFAVKLEHNKLSCKGLTTERSDVIEAWADNAVET